MVTEEAARPGLAPDRKTSRRGQRFRALRARLLLLLFSTLFSLGLAEGALRLIENRITRDRAAAAHALINDPVLGTRLPANAPGHDANGFRNASAVRSADIIAVGDSQTWGINASREQAWPKQLEKLSGRSVYSMALGGWGPVQYAEMCNRVAPYNPKVVVVGIYFGNDLWDAYDVAYRLPAHAALRRPELTAKLARDTVGPRSQELWDDEQQFEKEFGRGNLADFGTFLRRRAAIGRLLDSKGLWPGKSEATYLASCAYMRAHPDRGALYDDGHVHTVFTTKYRLLALDQSEPRITEGIRLTEALLPRMQASVHKAGAKLLVLLIPTKETVYANAVRARNGSLDPVYHRLEAMETRARERILAACRRDGVQVADALPALREAVERHVTLYPPDAESHPNPPGYTVIASVVDSHLKQLRW